MRLASCKKGIVRSDLICWSCLIVCHCILKWYIWKAIYICMWQHFNLSPTAKRCLCCIEIHAHWKIRTAYRQIVTWCIFKMQSRFSFALRPLVLTRSGARVTPLFCYNGTIHIAVIFHPVFSVPAAVGEGAVFAFQHMAVFLSCCWGFCSLFFIFLWFLKFFGWMSYFGTLSSIAGFRVPLVDQWAYKRWWIISQSHHESKGDLLFHMTLYCWL